MPSIPTLTSALPSGGGFFLPSYDAGNAANSTSSSSHHTASTSLPPLPTEPQEPLRLSPSQLTRLRSHLDDRILSIQRRWAKRFHPPQSQGEGSTLSSTTSSPLNTVGRYVSAWTEEVIPLLVRIDPVGSSQSTTVIAYTMRTTEILLMGIIGYETFDEPDDDQLRPGSHEVGGGRVSSSNNNNNSSGLRKVLQILHLLDALWTSLMTGRRLSLSHSLSRSNSALSIPTSSSSSSTSRDHSTPQRDSIPLNGSMGIKTLSITDRVRLRNLLVDRRSQVRVWVGGLLGVVLAGPVVGDDGEEERQDGRRAEERRLMRMRTGMGLKNKRGRKRKDAPLFEEEAQESPLEQSSAHRALREGDAKVKQEEDAVGLLPAPSKKRKRRKEAQVEEEEMSRRLFKQEEGLQDEVVASSPPPPPQGQHTTATNEEEEEEEDEEELEEVIVPLPLPLPKSSSSSLSSPSKTTDGTSHVPHVPLLRGDDGEEEEEEVQQEVQSELELEPEPEPETEENRHYQALFDRKIDLDDDDVDEDDDDDDDSDASFEEEEEEEKEEEEEFQGRGPSGPPLFPSSSSPSTAAAATSAGNHHPTTSSTSTPDAQPNTTTTTTNENTTNNVNENFEVLTTNSFELDVLLARLFSRSLALLERLE